MFFDTPKEQSDNDFGPLPPGQYYAMVIDTDVKNTKKGDGKYVSVAFQITSGKHKGQRVFTNFNIENPNEKAVKIGRAQFKSFLASCGVTDPLHTEVDYQRKINNKMLMLDVIIETGKDGVNRNRVKKFSSKELPVVPAVSQNVATKSDASEIPF